MNKTDYHTVWITGASDGIGKSIALELAKQGKMLILSGRNREKLEQVQNQCVEIATDNTDIGMEIFDCTSLADSNHVAQVLASKIDVAIFCAGVSQRAFSFDMSTESDENIHAVNFLSPIESSKMLIRNWKDQQEQKKIIYISSIASQIPSPLRAMYGASKRALEFYCRISRNELRKLNVAHIQQSIVIPGFIRTEISKKALLGDMTTWGKMDTNQLNGMSTEEAAKIIVKLLRSKQQVLYVGMNAGLKIISVLSKYVPKLADVILSKVDTAR